MSRKLNDCSNDLNQKIHCRCKLLTALSVLRLSCDNKVAV